LTATTATAGAALPKAGGAMTGAITTNSTFDGRDVATDGSKLDGIESSATADQTAAEILTAIKTVDGAGSGLDADTLDGLDSSGFVRTAGSSSTFISSNSGGAINPNSVTYNGLYYCNSISLFGQTDGALYSQAYSSSWQGQIFQDYRTGQLALRGKNNGTWQSWRTNWDSGNDGSGSGLDADLLDGQQGSYYLNYNKLINTPTIPTNNNQLINGAGYVTANHTQELLTPTSQYGLDGSDNGRDFNWGIETGFVRAADSYPDYGSVIRLNTLSGQDGGSGELYFPYSSANGGDSLRYRLGKYNNAGWTGWKTIIDSSGGSITGDLTVSGTLLDSVSQYSWIRFRGSTINYGTNSVINWDYSEYTGSSITWGLGRITVDVAGVYLVSAGVSRYNTTTSTMDFSLYKNGTLVKGSRLYLSGSAGPNYAGKTFALAVRLSAADYLEIKGRGYIQGSSSAPMTYFSGVRIGGL
jgi:hypothetical protein